MLNFWTGFDKRAAAMKEVATVALIHKKSLLMGRRRDNDKWTVPGGHLEAGEDPTDGARREVMEEVGIGVTPEQLIKLRTGTITKPDGAKIRVHAYKALLDKRPAVKTDKDPDKEFTETRWVMMPGGLPRNITENLHVPFSRNVLLKALDWKKGA